MLTATVLAASIFVTACAPAPPERGTEPDPSAAEVVDPSYGAHRPADVSDVLYRADGYRGCESGVTHEPCGGSQTLDIYRHDPAAAPRGTIVFVHGGGFSQGDKSDHGGIGFLMAQRERGWDLVMANYRLYRAGWAQWPTAVADVAAAVDWVRTSGPSMGADPQRVVVAGHSAGGTLAALVGVAWNSGDDAYQSVAHVDGWISVAGILDFNFGGADGLWAPRWGGSAPVLSRMSPVSFLDAGDPPGYVVHGDADRFVPAGHSSGFSSVAARRGASVRFDLVDRWAGGAPMPATMKAHSPGGGVNQTSLNRYLDGI